ncbi:MAG: hypothetical protein ACI9RU_001934, partial [Litorivivens sp.]
VAVQCIELFRPIDCDCVNDSFSGDFYVFKIHGFAC